MNCCDDFGRCARGSGCPAGGGCYGQPGCQDTNCPGHPGVGQRAAETPPPITWRNYLADLVRVNLIVAAVILVTAVVVISLTGAKP